MYGAKAKRNSRTVSERGVIFKNSLKLLWGEEKQKEVWWYRRENHDEWMGKTLNVFYRLPRDEHPKGASFSLLRAFPPSLKRKPRKRDKKLSEQPSQAILRRRI